MSDSKPKRRMRNFLLDKPFQLKYTLAVVVISAILSVILGAFLYETQQEVFEANRENSQLLALDDPDMNQAMQEELAKADAKIQGQNRKLMLTLVVSLGALVFLLTLLGIVATHKIAGPAYAMRRIMSLIADGKHPHVRKLRKGDELRAVSLELKRMADNLRERDAQELEGLQKALEGLRAAGSPPEEITVWMEQVIVQKRQRLEADS
jgi:HAMP domain-containing protein